MVTNLASALGRHIPQRHIFCGAQQSSENTSLPGGGDFYDFLDLKDGRLGLVVGDATGHGMPAALVMATTRGMLRAVVRSLESPSEVLARVNEALVAEIPPSTFVTCFYGILEPESGRFRYANAGHNLPCCRRRDGQAEELRARGMPLGLMPGMSYEEKEAVLETGIASSSTAIAWSRPTTPRARCLAFRSLEGWSRSTMLRKGHWQTS